MKIAGFFFFVTVAFFLAGLLVFTRIKGMPNPYYFVRVLEGLIWIGPFVVLRRFGERPWICMLFLLPGLAGWVNLVVDLLGGAIDDGLVPLSLNSYMEIWIISKYVDSICILLSLIGCFLVKAPDIRKSFRFWGRWGSVFFFVSKAFAIHSSGYVSLRFVVDLLFYVPLLFLLFKVWRQPPSYADLENKVKAIGEPENHTA